ncbi:MAG TPA: BON domain-containing protein [Candidatus Baltobacteraceae bacterium]|nr:BON domain-containing protein [Candidatus Baltobacteraceae bacterium]
MKILSAFVLAAALAGCSAQDQRATSNTANDAYLVAAVGAKLASVDVDAVNRVRVAASHGVVTLSGEAHDPAERARYVDTAKSVNGVASVRDDLAINPRARGLRGQASDAALSARVSAAIAGQAGVNALHVQPSVHNGNVMLEGTVPSASVHETILQTVRGLPGVKGLTDRITVKP